MHGNVAAVTALQRSDLIVALGARFDDRVTGKLSTFAPQAAVVHADIDPAEISKNRTADVPIVGDCREVIADLVVAVEAEHAAGRQGDYTAWWRQLDGWRQRFPLGFTPRRTTANCRRNTSSSGSASSSVPTPCTSVESASTRCVSGLSSYIFTPVFSDLFARWWVSQFSRKRRWPLRIYLRRYVIGFFKQLAISMPAVAS